MGYDNRSFLLKGKSVEDKFMELFKEAKRASVKEDIYDGIDVKIQINIDVKAMKKINRSDDSASPLYAWVEIKNIKGKDGWLYSKKVDFFTFETYDHWIIVDKFKLQDLISSKTIKEYKKKEYHLYRRNGRKDIIVLVPMTDIVIISESIIPKNEED